jgi:hypothetical protein
MDNYSTSKPFKASPEKSHIFSCDSVAANERYYVCLWSISKVLFFCDRHQAECRQKIARRASHYFRHKKAPKIV